MSPRDVRQASGRSLTTSGLCLTFKNGPLGVALEFNAQDSLQYIALDRGKVRTTRGVKVGDRTSKIFKVYGSEAKRLSRSNDKVAQGFDVVYTPRNGPYKGYRLAFGTYRNRIVLIAAGRPDVAQVAEFCA